MRRLGDRVFCYLLEGARLLFFSFRVALVATSLIIASAAVARADTTGVVRGTVTLGGKPAAATAVRLTGERTTLSATTDAAGSFTFGRVEFGHYTITATRPTAPSFSEPVDVTSDAVISLAIDLGLREIGHAQTATSRGVGATPVSVNTIGSAQIAALPDNQRLDSVIETVPGIVRFSYNEPVAHGFHGLSYELDGVPLPQGTSSNFGEIVDPRSIDSLEVFTGAFPAEFGGSREGAVVNIISHRAVDLSAPSEGYFTIGGGNYAGAQTYLSESSTFGSTRIFVNANLERTSRGIDSPTFDPVHDNSNQSNQFIRTITNVGKYHTLAFDASNNETQFQIPINTVANPNDPVAVPPSTADVQRETSRFFNAVFTANAKDGTAYTQVAPWYRYDRVAYDGDLANDLAGTITSGGTSTALDGLRQDRHAEFYGLRLTRAQTFGPNSVKLGVDQSVENFRGDTQIAYLDATRAPASFSDNARQRGTNFGAYLQDKWAPTPYLSVLAGGRYDHSTGYVSGGQLSPRIEINARFDPQDIFHVYYGRLYAAPFIEDTRRAAVVVGGAAGDPVYDLKPEHDSYYEFGISHEFTPGARATANFWKRDVQNVLDTTQLAQTPVPVVFNNTIGIAKGVEGRVDARYRNGDAFFLSTTLSNSRAGGISGSTFLFAPGSTSDVTLNPEDHDQTFTTTIGYTKRIGPAHDFFASVEPEYGTGYPVQFQNGPGRLPPHLLVNASFGRDPGRGADRHLGFTADFENMANYHYLIKVNNGFNTTQWGEGLRVNLRATTPL